MSETLTTPEQPNFQASIDAITSRRLTPENLNQYADEALNDLVGVVDEAVQAYRRQPTIDALSPKEEERASFAYYGMEANVVEATLDHIAEVADHIHGLDTLIAAATVHSRNVLIPPDSQSVEITPGDGSFQEKQTIPRTKTLAFILENQFDIDLRDPEQFTLTIGALGDNMMRGQSYNLVETPALNRAVFVCDEEGNSTFVFDTARLADAKLDSSILARMTKDELSGLLERQGNLGRRVVYSPQFVERMVSLFEEIPQEDRAEIIDDNASQFLKPNENLPEGSLAYAKIAERLEVSARTVSLAIKELQDQLSPVSRGRAKYYLPEDQQKIHDYLEEKGVLVPRAREDQLAVFGMAKKFEVPRSAIVRALKGLGAEIGDVAKAKFETSISSAYSPEQQELVKQWLDKNEKGGLSELQLAEKFNTSRFIINKIRKELSDEGISTPLVGTGRRVLVPASQHELIGQLVEKHHSKTPRELSEAPEGYESKMDIVRRLGIHSKTVTKAIEATQEELGDVPMALFSNNPSPAYSPEQQRIIEQWLSENMRRQRNSRLGRALVEQSVSK